MKNRKKFLNALLISASCLVAALLIYFVILPSLVYLLTRPEKTFYKELNSIASESEDIPYIEAYGSLYKRKELISVYGLCDNQHKDFSNMLCVYNNIVYFVYEVEDAWCVASVDMDTLEMHTHFKLENPAEIYNIWPTPGDFKKLNGYYYDGKIVLNDHKTVLEYDLTTRSTTQYSYSEYNFPVIKVYGSNIDSETIIINTESGEKVFTLEEISKKSSAIATIYSFKDRLNWKKRPHIIRFFSENSVQYVDGKIYVIGEMRDYYGQAYAVIFEYDEAKNKWKYITNVYTWDSADEAYIVPHIKEKYI